MFHEFNFCVKFISADTGEEGLGELDLLDCCPLLPKILVPINIIQIKFLKRWKCYCEGFKENIKKRVEGGDRSKIVSHTSNQRPGEGREGEGRQRRINIYRNSGQYFPKQMGVSNLRMKFQKQQAV